MKRLILIFIQSFLLANMYACMLSNTPQEIINLYSQVCFNKFVPTEVINTLIVAGPVIGSVFGALIVPKLTKYLGMKNTIINCCIICFIINLITLIPVHWGYLFAMRIIIGIFSYSTTSVAPGWLDQFANSSKKHRSILNATFEIFVSIGVLINNALLHFTQKIPRRWWFLLGYAIFISGSCILTTILIKEKTKFHYNRSNESQVLIQHRKNYKLSDGAASVSIVNAILIGISVEVTGITRTLSMFFGNYGLTIITSLERLVLSGLGSILNIKFIRKPLLITGLFICAAGNAVMCISYELKEKSGIKIAQIIAIVLLLIGFEMGPAPQQYILAAEAFPSKYHVALSSLMFSSAAITQIFVYGLYRLLPKQSQILDMVFACITMWLGILLVGHLPETFQVSQREIEKEVMGEYFV
ncbi:Sugar_(And other) transporter family protein [Hexamita inflata]|uniref:Sugar_(And other) transporter family protein n=1 Tax=Hexamita inflata TaxID=28002 RepID=A0ABP1H1Z9_9EUKA